RKIIQWSVSCAMRRSHKSTKALRKSSVWSFPVWSRNNWRDSPMSKKREVQSSVKDESLIEKRRAQMIRGAVMLFKEKGFHRTTTRETAKASGVSIGTLYEYIRTKEDVLYLVCDSIYDEVHARLDALDIEKGSLEVLVTALEHYYGLIDDMQDEFVVMYQES